MSKNKFYEEVNNYTKFKLVDMLIEKHKDNKLDNLNVIEDIADNVLDVLAVCGLKFYGHMKKKDS